MRYYEFNKADYYALLAVKESKGSTMMKAMKLYVEHIAYDDVTELRVNGLHPNEISKDEALLKFLKAPGNEELKIQDAVKLFNNCEDGILLIDSALA